MDCRRPSIPPHPGDFLLTSQQPPLQNSPMVLPIHIYGRAMEFREYYQTFLVLQDAFARYDSSSLIDIRKSILVGGR